MTFNSFEFLIFFPIFLLCYFLLPKKLKMPAMLAMSYWFYAAWNFRLLALIIFTTAVSYFCALAMEKTDKKSLRRLYITLTLSSVSARFSSLNIIISWQAPFRAL